MVVTIINGEEACQCDAAHFLICVMVSVLKTQKSGHLYGLYLSALLPWNKYKYTHRQSGICYTYESHQSVYFIFQKQEEKI
jgi:hypothetical protein